MSLCIELTFENYNVGGACTAHQTQSKEIRHEVLVVLTILAFWHILEDYELALAYLLHDLHQGGFVARAIAVVWCRPHRHQLPSEPILVALLHQLVGSSYEL